MDSEIRKLRACILCSLVKSFEEFRSDGCDNCESYLHLRGDTEKIMECTSTDYSGLLGLVAGDTSWVASWLRIQNRVPGMYAVKVNASLPEEILDDIRNR